MDVSQQPPSKGNGVPLVVVFLGAAAVVIAITFYVAFQKPPVAPGPKGVTEGHLEQVLSASRLAMQQNRYELAEQLMTEYVRSNPDDLAVRPLLAEAQIKLGRDTDAELTINDILRRTPSDPDALWTKGLLAGKRDRDPLPYFRAAAQSPASRPEIWARYGRELAKSSRVASALASRTTRPASRSTAEAYRDQEAAVQFRRALDAGYREPFALAGLAEVLLVSADSEGAVPLLTEAIEKDPKTALPYALLAQAQRKAGELEKAVQTLRKALEQADFASDDRAQMHQTLGDICSEQEHWLEAGDAYADFFCLPAARCYCIAKEYTKAGQQVDKLIAMGAGLEPVVMALRKQVEAAGYVSTRPATSKPSKPAKPHK